MKTSMRAGRRHGTVCAASLLERGRRGEPLADLGIIDMHGHLGRAQFVIPDLAPERLVAAMDRIGVQSIVCSHVRCLYSRPELGNDEVFAAMQAHPGRILGYVILVPKEADAVRAETERRFRQGFVGIKLHNHSGIPYTEPGYEPALAMADERRMPVLLHTWGEPECMAQVRSLAAKFPNISLLLAHAGAANEQEYVKLTQEFENIVLDLTYSVGPRGLVERFVESAGVDRIVWGSDAIFLNIAQQIGKVLGARISDDDKRKILSENARRILGRIQS